MWWYRHTVGNTTSARLIYIRRRRVTEQYKSVWSSWPRIIVAGILCVLDRTNVDSLQLATIDASKRQPYIYYRVSLTHSLTGPHSSWEPLRPLPHNRVTCSLPWGRYWIYLSCRYVMDNCKICAFVMHQIKAKFIRLRGWMLRIRDSPHLAWYLY